MSGPDGLLDTPWKEHLERKRQPFYNILALIGGFAAAILLLVVLLLFIALAAIILAR